MSESTQFPAHIASLNAYVPGQSIDELARRIGMPVKHIVKLASNENPLGPSPRVAQALGKAAVDVSLYPDNDCLELTEALAGFLGVSADWIVVGAGSENLLGVVATACLAPGRSALYTQYSFQAFANAVQRIGARAHIVPAPGFAVDPGQLLAAITEDTALVYIANPGNPTGTHVGPERIHAFLQRVPAHVTMLLDEAYREYLPAAVAGDAVAWAREFPNLVVTRTFSKAYGLAGLRVGYAVAQPGMAAVLRRIRAPFSVTRMAQVAAIAALGDQAHLQESVRLNGLGMTRLTEGLDRLGLRYLPSFGNFVLVEVGDGQALARAWERQGLIVRPVGGYGLASWVRISVGTEADNARVLQALAGEPAAAGEAA